MQNKVMYFSQNKLHICTFDTQAQDMLIQDTILSSPAVERFLRNSHEADTRDNWKTDKQDDNAMFRLLMHQQQIENPSYRYTFTGVAAGSEDSFYYSAIMGEMTGIYQQFLNSDKPECIVLSDNHYQIEDITIGNGRIYASVREKDSPEAHIAMIGLNRSGITFLTDGDCIDSHPVLSPLQPNMLYYVTSGFGRLPDGELVGKGPQYISCLSLDTMEQEEILCNDEMDYWNPQVDTQGNLYYLQRPYSMKRPGENPFISIVKAPFRLLGAIGGALNYFTIRYSGKSLQSGGKPSDIKIKQKKPEDLLIEGNFVQAEKEYQKNLRAKEKYPGLIPKNWELCCRKKNGEITRILQGVSDYTLLPDSTILYANGNHLLYHGADGKDRLLVKTDLPNKLHVIQH